MGAAGRPRAFLTQDLLDRRILGKSYSKRFGWIDSNLRSLARQAGVLRGRFSALKTTAATTAIAGVAANQAIGGGAADVRSRLRSIAPAKAPNLTLGQRLGTAGRQVIGLPEKGSFRGLSRRAATKLAARTAARVVVGGPVGVALTAGQVLARTAAEPATRRIQELKDYQTEIDRIDSKLGAAFRRVPRNQRFKFADHHRRTGDIHPGLATLLEGGTVKFRAARSRYGRRSISVAA